jgi:type II secretory pathway component PulK
MVMMPNQRGAILLLVLIVVLTISLLGATLIALFFSVLSSSHVELDRTKALYLAEAGIAKAVSMLRGQTGAAAAPSTGNSSSLRQIVPPTRLGDGYFQVYADFSQSAVISTGVSHGVKRVIQMKYEAF